MPTDHRYVFISYSSRNYDAALQLKELLNQNHIACWMAPGSIPAGGDYIGEIPQAISGCSAFLLLLTSEAQTSKWVPKELGQAITAGKRVIPFQIDGADPNASFGFLLHNVQRIMASGRYEEAVRELLQQVGGLAQVSPEEREPFLDLLMGSAMPDDRFVGREVELRRIEEELTQSRVAFLSGLGGMGKTELALRYGDGYRNAGRGQVYFVRFKKTFDQTVTDNIAPYIPDFNRDGLNERQIIDGAMHHLRRGDPNDLLILDNVDEVGSYDALTRDPVFKALCRLPMKLLVTTRLHARGGIPLEPLSNPELYRFFDQHDLDLAPETMDKLIAAVNAHTMTVDLMARTMDESWETVTAEMILEAMKSSSLPEADYPEVYTDHNQDPEQRQIYAHLRSLFTLTNIPEDGKQALRCATLLPQAGMDPALFLRGLPKGPADAIRLLEKQGWVQRENHLLTIHPVVRMVCRRELEPTEERCWPFVKGVWGWYDPNKYDHVRFTQIAELLTNAAETLMDPDGWYIGQAGYLWNRLAEYQYALKCSLRAVELREQSGQDSRNLAAAYNNVSQTYSTLGNHEMALEYQLKALAVSKKVLSPEHPDLAAVYSNVGLTYSELSDHPQSLNYQLKALSIRKKALPPEHPDLAASYNNLAVTYGTLGDYTQSLEYHQKALSIFEKVLPLEHPDLATSYDNVGYSYGKLGNSEKELEYNLKALAIRERVLPSEHPSLALSCNNIALTYCEMDDYETALNYMLRAADIAEHSLPEGHLRRVNYRIGAEWIERKISERQTSE